MNETLLLKAVLFESRADAKRAALALQARAGAQYWSVQTFPLCGNFSYRLQLKNMGGLAGYLEPVETPSAVAYRLVLDDYAHAPWNNLVSTEPQALLAAVTHALQAQLAMMEKHLPALQKAVTAGTYLAKAL